MISMIDYIFDIAFTLFKLVFALGMFSFSLAILFTIMHFIIITVFTSVSSILTQLLNEYGGKQ
jgi:hypothetical protein